jgi:hypothetical protein
MAVAIAGVAGSAATEQSLADARDRERDMDGDVKTGTQTAGLTRELAARAAALGYADLPENVREVARQCVLDCLGVAIAGAGDPLVGMLLDEMAEAGGAAQASIVGHDRRLPALAAALVNGARGMRSISTTSMSRCRDIRRSRCCRVFWQLPNFSAARGARY